MNDLMTSELVSKYNYTIISDNVETIFCKPESVPVTEPIKDNYTSFCMTIPTYMEDFSFRYADDLVQLYVGDALVTSITVDELDMILHHIHSRGAHEEIN